MKKPDIKDILIVLIRHLKRILNKTGLTIFMVAVICATFGAIVSYKYIIFPMEGDFYHENGLVEIDTETYRKVREVWDEREMRFERAEDRIFKDPLFPVDTNLIEENLSMEDLEDLLVQTLFEFYETKGEGMPPISERALIWEELGLGNAQEYQGIYSQNILLLRTLKEMIRP